MHTWSVQIISRLDSQSKIQMFTGTRFPAAMLVYLRTGSWLACVCRVMDARGKFGGHETRAESNSIFINMIPPKSPRVLHKFAYFSSRDPRNTHGYWAEYLYALHTWDRSVMRSCPEKSVQSSLFVPSTSPQRRKPPSCCTSSHARKLLSLIS